MKQNVYLVLSFIISSLVVSSVAFAFPGEPSGGMGGEDGIHQGADMQPGNNNQDPSFAFYMEAGPGGGQPGMPFDSMPIDSDDPPMGGHDRINPTMDHPGGRDDDNPQGQMPVPEPATMILVGAGLLGVACFGRKINRV